MKHRGSKIVKTKQEVKDARNTRKADKTQRKHKHQTKNPTTPQAFFKLFTEIRRVWDVALFFLLFCFRIRDDTIATPRPLPMSFLHGIVLTHLTASDPPAAKTSPFIETLEFADDQLALNFISITCLVSTLVTLMEAETGCFIFHTQPLYFGLFLFVVTSFKTWCSPDDYFLLCLDV